MADETSAKPDSSQDLAFEPAAAVYPNGNREQTIRNTPKVRACTECRQQKLRCDLVNAQDPDASTCSRCKKLGLLCRIDDSFKRTRKRRRSHELELEVDHLRRQLSAYTSSMAADWTVPLPNDAFESRQSDVSMPQDESSSTQILKANSIRMSTTVPGGISPGSPDQSSLPGMTTIPQDETSRPRRQPFTSTSFPQTLANIELSPLEIDELFQLYFSSYHPYLPFLDQAIPPHQYHDASPPLFWSIISVAARRLQTNPTLMTRLARSVPDLIWKSIQTLPHTLGLIQSLVLICTWPFPTSSSSTDPTYMHAGLMVQLGIQMGLHRPTNPQDFTKYPLQLSSGEIADRRRTWVACNIAAQNVSTGVGLASPSQLRDWSLMASSSDVEATADTPLRMPLKCAALSSRISQALASSSSHPNGLLPARERSLLYAVLDQDLARLENSVQHASSIETFYFLATKLHLHAFSLFDEPSATGYLERIVTLYATASSVVEHVQSFQHIFVLLKIVKNDSFSTLIDAANGRKMINFAVTALRRISVANNDLPGRLSDVLAYLWTHPDPSIIGGLGFSGLQLKVQSRMSMSIVYDCLWRWREQFLADGSGTASSNDAQQAGANGSALFDHSLDAGDLTDLFTEELAFDMFV